jgi:hypothetical protein
MQSQTEPTLEYHRLGTEEMLVTADESLRGMILDDIRETWFLHVNYQVVARRMRCGCRDSDETRRVEIRAGKPSRCFPLCARLRQFATPWATAATSRSVSQLDLCEHAAAAAISATPQIGTGLVKQNPGQNSLLWAVDEADTFAYQGWAKRSENKVACSC